MSKYDDVKRELLLRDLSGDAGTLKEAFRILDETDRSFAKYDLDTSAMRVLREATTKAVCQVASCRTIASGMINALETIIETNAEIDRERCLDEREDEQGKTEYEALEVDEDE